MGLIFEMDWSDANLGVEGLAATPLTINGSSPTPEFQFAGADATVAAWVDRQTSISCASAGAGTDPTIGLPGPCVADPDGAVLVNSAKTWQAPNNTLGDIGTEDIFLECVLRIGNANTRPFGKRTGNTGWMVALASTTQLWFYYWDAGGYGRAIAGTTSSVIADHWVYAAFTIDRDLNPGARGYANAINNHTYNYSARTLTCTSATPLQLGTCDTTNPFIGGGIAWASLWLKDAWFPGTWTEIDEIARQRAAIAMGHYAQTNTGGDAYPGTL